MSREHALLADAVKLIEEGVRLYETYGLLAQPSGTDGFAAGRWVNGCRDFLNEQSTTNRSEPCPPTNSPS